MGSINTSPDWRNLSYASTPDTEKSRHKYKTVHSHTYLTGQACGAVGRTEWSVQPKQTW